jgi:hypothetical protein
MFASITSRRGDFMSAIYSGPLGPSSTDGNFSKDSESATPSFDSYEDKMGDKPRMLEANNFTVNVYDKFIGAQL